MPHGKEKCRYCPLILDRRGLTPHEMSHDEFTPRIKTTVTAVASAKAPKYQTSKERVRERVRQSMEERAVRRGRASLRPYPPEEPAIKEPEVIEPPVQAEEPQAPPEIPAMLSGRIRVPKDLINEAMEIFTTDPLLFNVYCYFMAPTKDDVEQIINLKTAMQFIDLKIQQLGGWTEEEMTG